MSGAEPTTGVDVTPHAACAAGAKASAERTSATKARRRIRESYPPIVTAATSAIRLNVACENHPGIHAVRPRADPGQHAAEADDHRQGDDEPVREPEEEADGEDRRPAAEPLEQRVAETAVRHLLDERDQGADHDAVDDVGERMVRLPVRRGQPLLVAGVREVAVDALRRCRRRPGRGRASRQRARDRARPAEGEQVAARARDREHERRAGSRPGSARRPPSTTRRAPAGRASRTRRGSSRRARSSPRRAGATARAAGVASLRYGGAVPVACSLQPRLTAPSPRCAPSPSGSSPSASGCASSSGRRASSRLRSAATAAAMRRAT